MMDEKDACASEPQPRRRTILVVDDEPINRMVLKGILPREFGVLMASSVSRRSKWWRPNPGPT